MKKYCLFALFSVCGGSLLAQSDSDILAESVLSQTKHMHSSATVVSRAIPVRTAVPSAPPPVPPIENILSVIGANPLNSGVPCFNCVAGAIADNIGLLFPEGTIHADGISLNYAVNNFLINNSVTDTCNFTFAVRDAAKKIIAAAGPFAIPIQPGSGFLTATAVTIPHSATVAGAGLMLTVVQCPAGTTVSSSPVYIAYP